MKWIGWQQVLGIWAKRKLLPSTVIDPELQRLEQRQKTMAERAAAEAAAAARVPTGVDELMQEGDIGDATTFRCV
jgi:hypothetical protein